MKVVLVDKDGKKWEFPDVISIEVREKDNWCNIKYNDKMGEYHEEVGDIPAEIHFE